MAEYIERDKIVKWLRRVARLLKATETHKGKTKLIGQIIDHINKTSLADVVEVVRCKDCKHSAWRKSPFGVRTFSCQLLCADIKPEDFCSYGERKDGADVQNT